MHSRQHFNFAIVVRGRTIDKHPLWSKLGLLKRSSYRSYYHIYVRLLVGRRLQIFSYDMSFHIKDIRCLSPWDFTHPSPGNGSATQFGGLGLLEMSETSVLANLPVMIQSAPEPECGWVCGSCDIRGEESGASTSSEV